MREYDVYFPATRGDGKPVDEHELSRIKQQLTEVFDGYTHLQSRSEGAWQVAGVTFHDEVTILRVLDSEGVGFDFPAFKKSLERRLDQESVLIVSREVEVIR